MKKITVNIKKIPAVAAQTIVTIETVLHGQELVAYKTETGTVCLLQKLTKQGGDFLGQKEYGFCNMAYSNTGPCFRTDSWWGAVKLAAKSRELVAFDNYQELLAWICHDFIGTKESEFQKTPFVVGQKVLVADQPGSVWIRRWFRKRTVHGTFEAYSSVNMYDGTSFWNMCIPYDERLEGTIVR